MHTYATNAAEVTIKSFTLRKSPQNLGSMITIFYDFSQFSAKKCAFFLTNVMIKLFLSSALF
jgi:hypothetical protein